MTPLIIALIAIVGIPLAIVILVYLLIPMGKGIAWFVRHIFRFVFSMLGDALRVVGALLTCLVLIPLTLANVIIGRWSGAAHFGRAIESEAKSLGACFYRLLIGHPARLFCVNAMTEGLERRIPQVVANAPGADRPARRVGQFDGYTIVGSLPGGGSGSKLYVAEPSREKLAAFARAGQADVDKVVIKCFSLLDGSSLPQIVRENRALVAAKRLGLILDDELSNDRFCYVMRYVPGDPLGVVVQRLHAVSGAPGLADKPLAEAVDYAADLLRTLHHYHSGGLWHKDVKPDNIIVANGQAHLVDFGLVTPLRSSMTLTTHGTEYFRDPEMVRMALRGVKVHEVDGAKFDIYAAGAVLYAIIENSFPAHGGLSQITKRCPEALRWIVRRAMTDYDKRYDSSATMLADVEAVLAASDPFALKPVDLPSVRAGESPEMPQPDPLHVAGFRGSPMPSISDEVPVPRREHAFAGAAAAIPAAFGGVAPFKPVVPAFRITNWWTGKYDTDAWKAAAPAPFAPPPPRVRPVREPGRSAGITAAEQLSRARSRASAARERAHRRMARYRKDFPGGINAGVLVSFLIFLGGIGLLFTAIVMPSVWNKIWQNAFGDDQRSEVLAALENLPPIIVDLGDGRRMEVTPRLLPSGVPVSVGRDRHIVDDRRSHAEPVFEPGQFGSVVVMRDQISYSAEESESVDRQIAGLERAGFSVAGEHRVQPGMDADARQREEQVVAELRSQIGVKPFASSDASRAIREWLDRTPAYAMVIWFGRNDAGENETWIVARRALDPDTLEHAASTLGDLTTAHKTDGVTRSERHP